MCIYSPSTCEIKEKYEKKLRPDVQQAVFCVANRTLEQLEWDEENANDEKDNFKTWHEYRRCRFTIWYIFLIVIFLI